MGIFGECKWSVYHLNFKLKLIENDLESEITWVLGIRAANGQFVYVYVLIWGRARVELRERTRNRVHEQYLDNHLVISFLAVGKQKGVKFLTRVFNHLQLLPKLNVSMVENKNIPVFKDFFNIPLISWVYF